MGTLIDAVRSALHLVLSTDPDVIEYAGRSLLIALVSAVWAVLLFGVAMRVVAIARAGDDRGSPLSSGVGG